MKIKLIRKLGNAKFTEGRLYIDGEFECFTVEDADRRLEVGGVKIQGLTAIPKGIYEVILSRSVRFSKLRGREVILPEILNVPGFTGIRIHSGNSSKDTEGCIIVGALNDSMDNDFVGASKVAMERLFPKIQSALRAEQKVTIEII